MKIRIGTLVAAGALAVTLTACGSDSDDTAAQTPTTGTEATQNQEAGATVGETMTCPTEAPTGDVAPEWELDGSTGSVGVVGSTDSAAPVVDVDTPFMVDETVVETLQAGDGPVVEEDASVTVCYVGVNGRDGEEFDNSYESGTPVDFPLNGVIPGFQKAIAGQNVGSTVGVAMTSEDGYGQGNPAAGIEAGDTLVFAIKILDAQQ